MTARLAIDGGTPIRVEPMPPWPAPEDDEVIAVTRVLQSGRINYWTGTEGKRFEEEYAQRLGRSHGIALANGTVALELALRAFCIGPGDEVIIPARTFIATASACVAVGATPVIADIDADSGCMTVATVSDVLSPRTRAIIPVHLAGWPAEMPEIMSLADDHGLIVIEDCAQAHGARIHDREIGAWGHAAAFSFCQDKIITTGGEGGLLVLDDSAAYQRAWEYKDHGKSLTKLEQEPPAGTSFRWLHDSFGTNWRMTEMQSAIGRVCLRKLDDWVAARYRNAMDLAGAMSDSPGLHIPVPGDHVKPAYYRLMASLDIDSLIEGWTRDMVIEAIRAEGVPCFYGSCAEVYREAAFAAAGLGPASRLPMAHRAHETSLAFLVHPTLTEDDMIETAAAVRKVLEVAVAE